MKRVLQINVRLSEGGAAGVARTLHDALPEQGFESRFAYGYGPSGRSSPLESEYDALRLTSRAGATANLISHRIRGEEVVRPTNNRLVALKEALSSTDLVHLHAVHSYMLPPTKLLRLLATAAKPVVWTMHDQWLMTGRCAQPGTCEGWKTGCERCPDLHAYPPALIDNAAAKYTQRRQALRELTDGTRVSLVACAQWLGQEMRGAGFQDVKVITNSVDSDFWDASQAGPPARQTSDGRSFLFISRDLRDPVKVDLPLLRSLAAQAPGRVTVVGDNLSEVIPGVRRVAALQDRAKMLRLMREHTHLLFFSKVDYYPLTIAEALTAGMRVIASKSPASLEFSRHARVRIIPDGGSWLAALSADDETMHEGEWSAEMFNPRRMAADYASLYREMLGA